MCISHSHSQPITMQTCIMLLSFPPKSIASKHIQRITLQQLQNIYNIWKMSSVLIVRHKYISNIFELGHFTIHNYIFTAHTKYSFNWIAFFHFSFSFVSFYLMQYPVVSSVLNYTRFNWYLFSARDRNPYSCICFIRFHDKITDFIWNFGSLRQKQTRM